MDNEVESLKAAIQRLQGRILEDHHPAVFPPETLNQLWNMHYCTDLVNRQNRLPGALMDAGTVTGLKELVQKLVTILAWHADAPRVLSVATSSATSGSRGAARSIQRQLRVQFNVKDRAPDSASAQLPAHPRFEWAGFSAGDAAASQGCQYLQEHLAPDNCTVIAVQRVPWLKHLWELPDAHVHIKKGDYLFIWTGQDSMELLEEIESYQAAIVRFQVAKEASELRREELEALLEETKVPQRRGSRLICATEQVQLKHELQERLKHILHCEECMKAYLYEVELLVEQLTLHVVGFSEVHRPSNLLRSRTRARVQAELCWIVLNARQQSAAAEHPGAVAVVGDFICHDIYRQPGCDVGSLSQTLEIEVLSSCSSERGRAAAARHIRQLMQTSVDKLEERENNIFSGVFAALLAKIQA